MPKADAAEWFLRLLTTPDRAAGLAGDMSEEGRVSWWDTLRTAATLFFRNSASQPFRIALLILFGVFLTVVGALVSSMSFLDPCRSAIVALFYALIGYVLVQLTKGRDLTAVVAYVIAVSVLMLARNLDIILRNPGILVNVVGWNGHGVWFLCWALLFEQAFRAFFTLGSAAMARRWYLAQNLGQAS
jgi:hypothetical protein